MQCLHIFTTGGTITTVGHHFSSLNRHLSQIFILIDRFLTLQFFLLHLSVCLGETDENYGVSIVVGKLWVQFPYMEMMALYTP